jgi:hypothetical protein
MKRKHFIFIFLFLPVIASAQIDFESNCQSLNNWESLDMKGDGIFSVVKDESVPPGYGPNVIEMKGDNVILLAEDCRLSDGTLLVLWKDVNPQQNDADGILMFRAGFPENISYEHNVKQRRPQYWLEQDFDSGISLRYRDEKTEDTHLAMEAGEGLTYDKTWNPTGWIWQKIRLHGNNIYAKYWSVTDPEPLDWLLHAKNSNRLNGRFGVRGWSAHAKIAYFRASENDLTVDPPGCYLHMEKSIVLDNRVPSSTLFVFSKKTPQKVDVRVFIRKNEVLIKECSNRIHFSAGVNKVELNLDEEITKQNYFDIPKALDDGVYNFEIELKNSNGEISGSDKRRIEFRSNKVIYEKINQLFRQEKELSDEINDLRKNTYQANRYAVASQTARAMLELAEERIQVGNQDGAERAVSYADQIIKSADKLPHGQQHGGDYSLHFGEVSLSSQSFVMGQTYSMTIPWIVTGKTVDRDYQFRYFLCDEYGKNVHTFETNETTQTSRWEPGVHQQHIQFSIPSQFIPYDEENQTLPPVFTGPHFLAVFVFDPKKSKSNPERPWMLLDNPEAIQFFNVGSKYLLKPVYVSFEPVEISQVNLPQTEVLKNTIIGIGLKNISEKKSDLSCAITIRTASGKVVFEAFEKATSTSGAEELLNFNWTPHWAGQFDVTVQVFQNGKFLTKVNRTWNILLPKEMTVNVIRENHVLVEDNYYTPIFFKATHTKQQNINSCFISVWNEDKELFNKEFKSQKNKSEIITRIKVQPSWGYYYIRSKFEMDSSTFFYEKQIIATVVETRDKQIIVNGEPFIMKGVNVHGLWGNSREITDHSMKIMKEYGFNTLRGDHPNLWLVDLAYKNNLCWMVLGEFSCATTNDIFNRFENNHLCGAQEITRQFIIAYRDNAGVLFWNSCNEIGEELDEFLITLYPCFRVYDPYTRPVNYANLYGQDNWRGQDIMGINYYFGLNQTAKDRQPIIQRSVQVGFEKNLPVIYTEFNSFWGVHEQTGVEAIQDLGQFGLNIGMSGGTFYKLLDVPGKHPGLLDAFSRLQVRNPMGEALKNYHADAKVELLKRNGSEIMLKIQNKRNFTLRNPVLKLDAANLPLQVVKLKSIQPKSNQNVKIIIPNELMERTFRLTGCLTFETHFGLKNKIDLEVFATF